ncbi:MAG: hypothetical protein ACM3X0_10770 [Bacteroidota bacterium]
MTRQHAVPCTSKENMTIRHHWLASALLLGSNTLLAGSATGSLIVMATVIPTCRLHAAGLSPAADAPETAGEVTVSCSPDAFSAITLEPAEQQSKMAGTTSRSRLWSSLSLAYAPGGRRGQGDEGPRAGLGDFAGTTGRQRRRTAGMADAEPRLATVTYY